MRYVAIIAMIISGIFIFRHIKDKHTRMRKRHLELDEGYLLNMSMNYDTVERYGPISRKNAMPVPDSAWEKFEKDMPAIAKLSWVFVISSAVFGASILYLFRTWNLP